MNTKKYFDMRKKHLSIGSCFCLLGLFPQGLSALSQANTNVTTASENTMQRYNSSTNSSHPEYVSSSFSTNFGADESSGYDSNSQIALEETNLRSLQNFPSIYNTEKKSSSFKENRKADEDLAFNDTLVYPSDRQLQEFYPYVYQDSYPNYEIDSPGYYAVEAEGGFSQEGSYLDSAKNHYSPYIAMKREYQQAKWSYPTCCYDQDLADCCQESACCCSNFRFFGDFLYWNVSQDGLDYALDSIVAPATTLSLPDQLWFQGNFKQKSVSFTYKPGFRVGGFYGMCDKTWELGVVYTQLHGSYHNHVDSEPATLILSSQIPTTTDILELLLSNLTATTTSSKSQFHLSYDVGDILATQAYQYGCLNLQPYLGARFLYIKEQWNVHYNIALNNPPTVNVINSQSNWNSKLPAGGVTLGTSISYTLCNCLDLIGRIGVSCVGGKSKQRTLLDATYSLTSSSASAYLPTRVYKKKSTLLTGFEGALGLAYHLQCFGKGLELGAGYEFQSWFNLPTPIEHGLVIPGIKHSGRTDLQLHGLFVRAGFAF